MADMTELERRANQYITEHVAGGGRREDVLADWIRSDNADLQKYAKGLLAKDLTPPTQAPESIPQGKSYMDMAKDMAPVILPAAGVATAVGLGGYMLGKKKGEGIAPPSGPTEFDIQKQQLELERMQAQIDTERARAARLVQMANKGKPLQTQAQFSQPTPVEIAADTTSVKVPSPATVDTEVSKLEALKQRAADLTSAVQGQKAIPDGSVPPQFGPAGQPAGAIPPAPPMPGPAPSVTETIATGGNVNQAIQQSVAQEIDKPQTLRTGTGREVTAGQGPVPQRFAKEYKSAADVPKGYAFLPGGQYIDVLRNDLGQGTYTQQFTGREFPQGYNEAVEAGKNINRDLNRPTREQLKAQGAAMPETTEGIVRKVGPNKMVKVGGVAGALIALSDLAKAENSQQRREAVGNALLGFLPPGLDAGGLNADEQQLIKERLAQAAYAQQVGGGRGVAPPSAYPQGGLNYNSPRIR